MFAQSFHAEQGGVITQVVTMVAVIGTLGNGLFGAGMRAVQERETNVLRRYKVTPISPAPLLVASMVTGLLLYIPYILLMLTLARFLYGMPTPEHLISVLLFVSLGVITFRSIGLIVASVVNSMQESALIVTLIVATFISIKLFRWEKEEKIRTSAKLWLLAVLLPFILLGTYQAYSKENVRKTKILSRDLRRSRTMLIRNARIFVGDGKVIESGSVLIKNGKIEEVYEGSAPDAKQFKAEPLEGAGKTILPGLIDAYVHLGSPGGFYENSKDYEHVEKNM